MWRASFDMLRDELLAREAFDTLLEAKVLIERWRQHYNTIRPHSALGYRPPAPEARQPCAVASAGTKLGAASEGKTLTKKLASFMGAGQILTHLGEPLKPPPVTPARGPPTDWGELVQADDDQAIFQASSDDLPVIHIHSLGRHCMPQCGRPARRVVSRPVCAHEKNLA